MLQNASSLFIVAVYTAENELLKVWGWNELPDLEKRTYLGYPAAVRGRTLSGRAS